MIEPFLKELEELLYKKLQESEKGELDLAEILNTFDTKPEYGLRRINGGAIRLIREREDVQHLIDEYGKPFLKLNKLGGNMQLELHTIGYVIDNLKSTQCAIKILNGNRGMVLYISEDNYLCYDGAQVYVKMNQEGTSVKQWLIVDKN